MFFIDQKETYYVSVAAKSISRQPSTSHNDFIISATGRQINELRQLFTNMQDADNMSHFRSAIPFQPYHDDQPNQDYDQYISEAYGMIYNLGDEVARNTIEESRLFSDRPIDTSEKM